MADTSTGDFRLSRRGLLAVSAAVGGGLLIGFHVQAAAQIPPPSSPNAFIKISRDGLVTLVLPYVEMGQGAYTAQAQILSEELEVDPAKVRIEHAPPDDTVYGSPLLGAQITGGSASLRGAWMSLRTAGAAARMMLVEAAATTWKVRPSTCEAVAGEIRHRSSNRRLGYGALAEAAVRLPVPASPVLKRHAAYKTVGKAIHRLDSPAKIDGSARFSIDVMPPGVRFAVVAACPVFNGTLEDVDDRDALKITGVTQIVRLRNAVAVVGANTWVARKGLAALKITWNEGTNANLTTADLVSQADAALDRAGLVATNKGDAAGAEARASAKYEAVFRLPMLAHAALEPLNCTVHMRQDSCEVWVGSQILGRAHKTAAEAAGLPLDKVVVHNHLLGGGFGRRLEVDYVEQAVLIAKQVEGPVKVAWSREEDTQHDYYRYHNHSRITVALDRQNRPTSWRHKIVGPNIMERWLPIYQANGVDLDIVDAAEGPYEIPNVHIEFTRNEAPVGLATGNWRGVGATRNVYMVESVMDDLARRANVNPLAYRQSLMPKTSRARVAMELAASKAGWGGALPARAGRGLAVFSAFGSHLGFVAQVHVSPAGETVVQRVVCAVDAGTVVNPDIVRAQIEGGIIFGLSSVLHGEITIDRGRIVQKNFDDYPVLRMREAPQIDVHIISSTEDPGGVGEPGTSGAIAAVANAVFAATGKRAYSLPLKKEFLQEGA